MKMQSGCSAEYRILQLDKKQDPPDMWFAVAMLATYDNKDVSEEIEKYIAPENWRDRLYRKLGLPVRDINARLQIG